ncbi:hypothetical protein [Roseateles sp. DAIF2]|uniref:hypothetical protein n=1 Tax=Roseateles sp. DAIF2 TaxID=2714952 RepID=UPI0018A32F98|nr:hypothetical protein [Roseateles sp. DAIF2]
MRSILPSPFLKFALIADAVVGAAMAALQLLFAKELAAPLGLPAELLTGTGLFLVAYVALLLVMASRARLWAALVQFVVIGNVGWALGCAGLMLGGGATALGLAFLVVHIAGVLSFATLEQIGLRRSAPAGGAARTAVAF